MAQTTDPKFYEALKIFVSKLQDLSDEHFRTKYPTLEPKVFTTMVGAKYVRIVGSYSGSKSVHCFVDSTNGDVLMSAGWKAPAKHARGNIYSATNGMEGVNVHGANYLK
jgi:hypothetical protein